jgi:hypothetical protein
VPAASRASRTAALSLGAISVPQRAIVSASSLARMNVLTPSCNAYGSSSSTHRSVGPSIALMFSSRRISRGSRPAFSAAASMIALPRARSPG